VGLVACGTNPKPQVSATPPPAPPVQVAPAPPPPAPTPVVDPVATLIATSQRHFDAGESELKAGHLDKARESFDEAVEVLLESPYGARTDARMREHFDRLIDRINAYEVTALAQGDGFTEKKYEAAPIDEILKNATTFPAPVADAATMAAVKADFALYKTTQKLETPTTVFSRRDFAMGGMAFPVTSYKDIKTFYDKTKTGDDQPALLKVSAHAQGN
jgi:membrane-bound lytic murein transglycosylase D